jgi:hypothetical protein
MKRELKDLKRERTVSGCCPGHDDFPAGSYANRRSKKARAMGKAIEHRRVRRVKKHGLTTGEPR